MIAATDPKIRAIVILAGTSEPGIEISMGQNKYIVDHNPSLTQAQRDSMLAAARISLAPEKQTLPWLRFFMGYDPAAALVKVKVPTLYIQGETDQQVPAAQAEMGAKLIRSNGNKDVTVRLFPATNHLFVPDSTGDITKYDKLKSNKIRPEVLGAIADWLVIKLNAKQNDIKP
jgi:pimeloyl-ACP methyl ester carboxylesterase